jgi:hypothetical protein
LIQGSLFTRDFLTEGIRRQVTWERIHDEEVGRLKAVVIQTFDNLRKTRHPNEAVTEKDLIYPLLAGIGWNDLVLVQQSASKKGRSDILMGCSSRMKQPSRAASRKPIAGKGSATASASSSRKSGRASSTVKRREASLTKACPRRKCCVICAGRTTLPEASCAGAS